MLDPGYIIKLAEALNTASIVQARRSNRPKKRKDEKTMNLFGGA